MPALVGEHKEDKEKEVKPYRQWNEDRVGEARSWERGGEIRARTLRGMNKECARNWDNNDLRSPLRGCYKA